MKRTQFWLIAAIVLSASGAALLRTAAAAGEEVDVIAQQGEHRW